MNAERRKRLEGVKNKLDELISEVEDITQEEQAAFDNMPEGLQDSERGEKSQECIDNLENLSADISTASENIDEIIF